MAAYPFGILADRLDRRLQLGFGRSFSFGPMWHWPVRAAPGGGAGAATLGLAARRNAGVAGATIADEHLIACAAPRSDL